MKTAVAIICLFCIFLTAQTVQSAQAPVKKAGDVIVTDYFTLQIPEGWLMPIPPKTQPGGGVSVALTASAGDTAIAINVLPAPMSAMQLAEIMGQDMRKNGMKAGSITQKGDLCFMNIEGKTKGEGWFGSNGKVCAATMIFGSNPQAANSLLKAIKAKDASLFPRKVN